MNHFSRKTLNGKLHDKFAYENGSQNSINVLFLSLFYASINARRTSVLVVYLKTKTQTLRLGSKLDKFLNPNC